MSGIVSFTPFFGRLITGFRETQWPLIFACQAKLLQKNSGGHYYSYIFEQSEQMNNKIQSDYDKKSIKLHFALDPLFFAVDTNNNTTTK